MVVCPKVNKECEYCMSIKTHGIPELGEEPGLYEITICSLIYKNLECIFKK